MSNRRVLLLIAAFVAITFGSFIWYIATWNAEDRLGLASPAPGLALRKILPPEAPAPQVRATL